MTYPKQQAEAQMIFRKTGGFVQGNMTLRDYFAAKAMQAILTDPSWRGEVCRTAAAISYEIADAMLEERIK